MAVTKTRTAEFSDPKIITLSKVRMRALENPSDLCAPPKQTSTASMLSGARRAKPTTAPLIFSGMNCERMNGRGGREGRRGGNGREGEREGRDTDMKKA